MPVLEPEGDDQDGDTGDPVLLSGTCPDLGLAADLELDSAIPGSFPA